MYSMEQSSSSSTNNFECVLPCKNGFLTKLWDILNDEKNHNIICWSELGDSFQILNTNLLCTEILPKYFKTNRIESLIRQLHSYGFRKISTSRPENGPEKMEFSNKFFKRNQPELLAGIGKKSIEKPIQKVSENKIEQLPYMNDQLTAFKALCQHLLHGISMTQKIQPSSIGNFFKPQLFHPSTPTTKNTINYIKIEPKIEPTTSTSVKIEPREEKFENTIMKLEPEGGEEKIEDFGQEKGIKMAQKSGKFPEKIPSFIRKLWHILEDQENYEIIRWDETGQYINIIDAVLLARIILPKFFLHNNFSTFVRQLNMYGFRKISAIKNAQTGQVYSHSNFLRDMPDLLLKITRNGPEQTKNPRKKHGKVENLDTTKNFLHRSSEAIPESGVKPSTLQKSIFENQPRMSFPKKLFDILENCEFENFIKWDENGENFHILDQIMLCQKVLPQYFKHNNFNSFIRQLNFYQFHKLPVIKRQNVEEQIYTHPYFKRNRPELLLEIKRPHTGPPTMARMPTYFERKRPYTEINGLRIEEIE